MKGKLVAILTSLTDPMRYPSEDIIDLYAHRWEIELGYREMKQHLLESRFTLRSQLPELVTQELWGVLLAYNLIRYNMLLIAKSLPSVHHKRRGNVPRDVLDIERNARQFKLDGKRERAYPRVLKMSKKQVSN